LGGDKKASFTSSIRSEIGPFHSPARKVGKKGSAKGSLLDWDQQKKGDEVFWGLKKGGHLHVGRKVGGEDEELDSRKGCPSALVLVKLETLGGKTQECDL